MKKFVEKNIQLKDSYFPTKKIISGHLPLNNDMNKGNVN